MKEAVLYNIVAIVNEGYSDFVMEIAKDNGARGGTILSANGSMSKEGIKLYGLDIHPNKEMVLILVDGKIVEPILSALYKKAGSGTEAFGIFFSLPVSHASENLLGQYKGSL